MNRVINGAAGNVFMVWFNLEIKVSTFCHNLFCEKFVINANLGRTRNRKKVRWRGVDSLKILHFFRPVLPGQNICASILEVFIK